MNISEMVTRESQINREINMNHIEGWLLNLSGFLTKERKTCETFIQLCN